MKIKILRGKRKEMMVDAIEGYFRINKKLIQGISYKPPHGYCAIMSKFNEEGKLNYEIV